MNFPAWAQDGCLLPGGEPLLRNDLGGIIHHARGKGIYVSVSSNGKLVPEKIELLRNVNKIKLSLDGQQDVHDRIRGKGSFFSVMNAIQCCYDNSISTSIQCVLLKYNLHSIDYVLNIARKFHSQVSFQPSIQKLLWSEEQNPIVPLPGEYMNAINYIIRRKRESAPVLNSFSGLKYLYNWPNNTKIGCSAGILSCNVEPNGKIFACDRVQYLDFNSDSAFKNYNNAKGQFKDIKLIRKCYQCWGALQVEFNLICSFNFEAILNYWRISRNRRKGIPQKKINKN